MRRWERAGVTIGVVLTLVATACSSSSETLPPLEPSDVEVETTIAAATTTAAADPTPAEAEVEELWQRTLEVFETIGDERDSRLAGLADRVPEEETRQLATLYFITDQEIDLTSNAVFSDGPSDTLIITDCMDSSGTSVLGPTTAGFRAVSQRSEDGVVELSEIEAVPRCVQREAGQAALDNYEQFILATADLWTDPRLDHPSIGRFATDKAADASRAYLNQLADLGRLDDTVVNTESVSREIEIVGYRPGEITLRDCRHGDETFGTFDGDGERIDDLASPWRDELVVRMQNIDGEWLFDEVINRTAGDCQMGTSSAGLQLL